MAADKEAKEVPPASAPAGGGGWMPVVVVLVLVPAISFALAEFVLFPRLEKRLVAAGAGTQIVATPGDGAGSGSSSSHGAAPGATKAEPTFSYEFTDVVSNLAGSMKSRYIKVSFTAYSANPGVQQIVEHNRAKLLDATLSVLGALTLADLEDATVKNQVRSQLVQQFEAILHERVIEEIYFSEFVVQ
jgi:flagellar FliL protein